MQTKKASIPLRWLALGLLLSSCSTLKKPFYYEIEREGHTSYVLGTVHLGVEASELPGFVHDDFEKSKVFVSEVTREIIALADDEETAKRYLVLDFQERLKKRTSLIPRLKPATWKKLNADIQTVLKDFRGEFIEFLSPRAALGIISKMRIDDAEVVEVSRAEYYRMRFGRMDAELFRKADKVGKALMPIDRVQQINRCLDEIYIASIEEYYDTGRKADTAGLLRLIHAYRDGDEMSLLQLEKEATSLDAHPFEKCVLTERNRDWAEIIRQLDPSKGPYFIAVGALHLIGQGSVLSLLESEGFKTRRIAERK